MPDILMQSALAYQELMNYQYEFVCGRKGKAISVSVSFPKGAYCHLAGFHYARIEQVKNKKEALDAVLSGRINYQMLIDSNFSYFDRLECIIQLKDIIESNKFIFQLKDNWTLAIKLQADYFISTDDERYFFIRNNNPVSIFQKSVDMNYKRCSPKYTILKISRRRLSDNLIEEIYRRNGYEEVA